MSDINVEVVQIAAILPHPNADRLEIAQVLGTECCVQNGKHSAGELAVWFPPNILIPAAVGEKLGVAPYLKSGDYPGDKTKTKCRVGAARLRGVPSYGFLVVPADAAQALVSPYIDLGYVKAGDVVDAYFGACKYTPPPVREPGLPRPNGFNGDAAPDCPAFHKYTDIQNYYKYTFILPEGTPVRITEKLHGSNGRLGLISMGEGAFEFMAGSHNVNWKQQDAKGNTPLWWRMLTEEMVNLLTYLCDEQHSVILFGEVVGPGVQDLDYGIDEDCTLRVFDISVDGRYLNWDELHTACVAHGVQTVPLLYIGLFSKAVLDEHTYGPTQMAPAEQLRSKFKDREGCVVTPLTEAFNHGRVILKSVSADYHDRKGAVDHA